MKFFKTTLLLLFILVFGQLKVAGAVDVDTPISKINIVEVRLGGAVILPQTEEETKKEYVTLFNRTTEVLSLDNWSLQYLKTPTEEQCSSGLWTDLTASTVTQLLGYIQPGETLFIPRQLNDTGSGSLRVVEQVSEDSAIIHDLLGWKAGTDGAEPCAEGEPIIAPSTGKVLQRYVACDEDLPIDTQQNGEDFVVADSGLFGLLPTPTKGCYESFCPNLEGIYDVLPEGYVKNTETGECIEVVLENRTIFITEILPNAPDGDTGQEFIEIYNPNEEAVNLKGYKLQVGPSYSKEYVFSEGTIALGQYIAFSDTETGIVLPNTTGVQLRLLSPAGNIVSESTSYTKAGDDVSWALVEDIWIYTNQITPNSANKPYLEPAVNEVAGVTSVLAPCPVGKYRNPETNRCRNLETAVSQLKPCDEDEFRNPSTNRCNKVSSSSSSSLKPCSAGQERNPATNRCRKVSTLGISNESELPGIQDVQVENTKGKLNLPIIGASLIATLGYMLYEWRNEIRQKYYLYKPESRN